MNSKVLRLNKAGIPVAWLNWQDTATLISKNQVIWSLGEVVHTVFGGTNNRGERSMLELPSIVACDGKIKEKTFVPGLSNSLLFARDQCVCMYCGQPHATCELSRDHVVPTSKGGQDTWTNCVTACRRCNNRKGDKTPEQAGMELIAVPFVPNRHEYFFLSNHNVLSDQMDFLKSRFSSINHWV